MSKLSEVGKRTCVIEINGIDYTFTELSARDHYELEQKYPGYTGELGFFTRGEVSTHESMSYLLYLMMKKANDDIEFDEVFDLPESVLGAILTEVSKFLGEGMGDNENPLVKRKR